MEEVERQIIEAQLATGWEYQMIVWKLKMIPDRYVSAVEQHGELVKYNKRFILDLSAEDLCYLIKHLCIHLAYHYLGKRG